MSRCLACVVLAGMATCLGCRKDDAPTGAGDILILDLGGGVTMKLVRIPAGRFVMGSPDGEKGRTSAEGPQHRVTISKPFYMGVYEVTRAQFSAFARDAGYRTDAQRQEVPERFLQGRTKDDSLPAAYVSWNDASAFCQWVSKKTGKDVRLPTEAEWEYACRAGTSTVYPWGDDPDDGKDWCNAQDPSTGQRMERPIWSDGRRVGNAPVGSFRPNAYKLYDLLGNVLEWCQDWYGPYTSDDVKDPKGPNSGSSRVLRGGYHKISRMDCRSACRYIRPPDGWGGGLSPEGDSGFRVVVSVGQAD